MKENLLPCPFCGGRAEIYHPSGAGGRFQFRVRCTNPDCKAWGPGFERYKPTEKQSAEWWNNRADVELFKKIGRLKERIQIVSFLSAGLKDEKAICPHTRAFIRSLIKMFEELDDDKEFLQD